MGGIFLLGGNNMRKEERMRVDKYMCIDTVLYNSPNLLLVETRRRTEKAAYIICEGLSMSVDTKYNVPLKWDPYMTIPNAEGYPEQEGDIIMMYFPFECAGLKEAGIELAEYINSNMKDYEDIYIIGHSKGGVCIAKAAKWLKKRCFMVFVSAPFMGTVMADENKVKRRLNTPIEYGIYERFYKRHKVDLDIRPTEEPFRNCDYSGVVRHQCVNVISETVNIHTPMDLGCKYLNLRMHYTHGDGIVTVATQKILSVLYSNVRTVYIDASHGNSLSRYLSKDADKYIIA